MHSSTCGFSGRTAPSLAAQWPVQAAKHLCQLQLGARPSTRQLPNAMHRHAALAGSDRQGLQASAACCSLSSTITRSCSCCSCCSASVNSSSSSRRSSRSIISSSSSSIDLCRHRQGQRHRRSHHSVVRATLGSSGQQSDAGMANLFMAYALQMQQALARQQQQQQQQKALPGANVLLRDVTFHPPGSERPLLDQVNMHLGSNKLGLLIGRSGSGKTTLLQLLAGLTEQTSGQVYMSRSPLPELGSSTSSNGSDMNGAGTSSSSGGGGGGAASGGVLASNSSSRSSGPDSRSNGPGPSSSGGSGTGHDGSVPGPSELPAPTHIEDRMKQVGLVFQFPERHFLGDNLMSELTFTWPRTAEHWAERTALAARLQTVVEAVGMTDIPFDIAPSELSGGQQRRLALALQLVRQPSLLLLDEPLAGLDWKARREVITLLERIKQECTLLIVSHDLREIQPLVDCAWRMQMGGRVEAVAWPPDSVSDLED